MMDAKFVAPLFGGLVQRDRIQVNHKVTLDRVDRVYIGYARLMVQAYKMGRLTMNWWREMPVPAARLPQTPKDPELFREIMRFEMDAGRHQPDSIVATRRSVRSVLSEHMPRVFGSLRDPTETIHGRGAYALPPPVDSDEDSDFEGGVTVFVPPTKRRRI